MDSRKSRTMNRKLKRRTKSFTEALKEKYCVEDEPTFDFIIVSPKRKSNATEAELAHLRTVVLNEMDVSRAEIPQAGLTSLCPNVVDLDLANNLLESWAELLDILSGLPRVKYVNVSRNRLRLDQKSTLPKSGLSVENLALNFTGSSIEEVVSLSQLMPALKELHLCGNEYNDLANIDNNIQDGAFSSLECLRLNNNNITSWSEVWKLRMLPRLKFLILSGNPIQNIFYNNKEMVGETNTNNGNPLSSNIDDTAAMDTEEDLDNSRNMAEADCDDAIVDEEDIETEFLDDSNGDDGEEGDDAGDSSLEGRPVSRLDYHRDPEVTLSDDGSDAEQDAALSQAKMMFPQPRSSSNTSVTSCNINIPQSLSKKNVHNINYNNSRNSNMTRDSPFNGTPFDLDLPGFHDQVAIVPGMEGQGGEEDPDWPRLAAEQFLYDLIDQLDLGDTTTNPPSSEASNQSTSGSSLFTSASSPLWYSHQHHNSGPHTAAGPRVASPQPTSINTSTTTHLNNVDTNQNAATTSDNDEYISRMLAAISDDSAESEAGENLFARIYSDNDFIPRSVSMVDEETIGSPSVLSQITGLGNLGKSGAKRCLFSAASTSSTSVQNCAWSEINPTSVLPRTTFTQSHTKVFNVESQPVPAWNAGPPREHNGQSESDSCSDCEAEQHSLTATLRRELADLASSAVRSVEGPESWLEVNRTFTTSVRDTGDGYMTSTTHTAGGRIVVTGMTNTETTGQSNSHGCAATTGDKTVQSHSDQVSDNCTSGMPTTTNISLPAPFQHLQMLCLSNASVSKWEHLHACGAFPHLNNIRLKNNPLYSDVNNDDKRKLYIASLPRVTVLNGSEVTATEREKAERFYLRYFMDEPEKPGFYDTLVAKHGPPVKLVDIDLRAGYQEWATLTFKCENSPHFTRRLHLVEPVGRLRNLVSQVLGLPKWCFLLHHHPCGPSHPESERELVELRCEALPMSRFDFAEGDEIIVEVRG